MRNENIWKNWGLTTEELQIVFQATSQRRGLDHDDEIYGDDDADCYSD